MSDRNQPIDFEKRRKFTRILDLCWIASGLLAITMLLYLYKNYETDFFLTAVSGFAGIGVFVVVMYVTLRFLYRRDAWHTVQAFRNWLFGPDSF